MAGLQDDQACLWEKFKSHKRRARCADSDGDCLRTFAKKQTMPSQRKKTEAMGKRERRVNKCARRRAECRRLTNDGRRGEKHWLHPRLPPPRLRYQRYCRFDTSGSTQRERKRVGVAKTRHRDPSPLRRFGSSWLTPRKAPGAAVVGATSQPVRRTRKTSSKPASLSAAGAAITNAKRVCLPHLIPPSCINELLILCVRVRVVVLVVCCKSHRPSH